MSLEGKGHNKISGKPAGGACKIGKVTMWDTTDHGESQLGHPWNSMRICPYVWLSNLPGSSIENPWNLPRYSRQGEPLDCLRKARWGFCGISHFVGEVMQTTTRRSAAGLAGAVELSENQLGCKTNRENAAEKFPRELALLGARHTCPAPSSRRIQSTLESGQKATFSESVPPVPSAVKTSKN